MKNNLFENVLKYFKEICSIPHGSSNMEKISAYCMDFAKKHSLLAVKDAFNNVIIFKNKSNDHPSSSPVILQGHLDMVVQKEENYSIDFEKDGLSIYKDGDFLKAHSTTLGADNGIAIAMILAILEDDAISHPPIEAVFTTDEEIGMVGAKGLDHSLLKGTRMINIDSEDPSTLTVSCAGGSEFSLTVPLSRKKYLGRKTDIIIKGLKGGHSGVEIDKNRTNANILMGKILNHLNKDLNFELISISGGDKTNAIPKSAKASVVPKNPDEFILKANEFINTLELEAGAEVLVIPSDDGEFDIIPENDKNNIIKFLSNAPCGVIKMSTEIENLVETSLNLGILNTYDDKITIVFSLRSNKQDELLKLEENLKSFSSFLTDKVNTFGHYPPWEYKENSTLQDLYKKIYKEKLGVYPKVCAIHAGLECGIFAAKKEDFDCISIGPLMYDIHTTEERLSISSSKEIFEILLNLLKELKN